MKIEDVIKLSSLDRLLYWVEERESIRLKKEAGEPRPWTDDSILNQFRFCNVHREDDKVTKWITTNWREPYKYHSDLWFAMVVARKINWPETLVEIGIPIPWKPAQFVKTLAARKARGEQLESGAYMITAGTGAEWVGKPKYEFLASQVFTPLWENRAKIRPTAEDTLKSFHARLEKAGMTIGSFIAGQVVADTKYTEPLQNTKDWHTWAAIGPGSARGMNRLLGYPVKQPWKEAEWLVQVQDLQKKIPMSLHAQDVQSVLCETDKYSRVLLGEGQPRQVYKEKPQAKSLG